MPRARPQQDHPHHQADDGEQEDRRDPAPLETVTRLPSPPIADLFRPGEEGMKHLPDPRTTPAAVKGDATAKNRDPSVNAITSARALGGEDFKRLERQLARTKAALLEAEEDADLSALQKAFREAKQEHDEAAARYAAEAQRKAEVRHYRIVDNNQGKARLASGTGSLGQARLPPGKVVDSLNYDIASLRKQGIKLEEIPAEEVGAG